MRSPPGIWWWVSFSRVTAPPRRSSRREAQPSTSYASSWRYSRRGPTMHRGAPERAINAEALRRVLAAAERDAADLGSRVARTDNLLRALARDAAAVAGDLKRLDVD